MKEYSSYTYADAMPRYSSDQFGQLSEGLSFTITGWLPEECTRFSISLVRNNANRDVALTINPRLLQNYIVRNTKVAKKWGSEEVSSALPFRLRRGDRFSIQVLVTDPCYMISLNGEHFAKYKHRVPYQDVRILEVMGDVHDVEVQWTLVLSYAQRWRESEARDVELHLGDADSEAAIPQEWCLIGSPHSIIGLGLTLPYYGALPPNSLVEGRCPCPSLTVPRQPAAGTGHLAATSDSVPLEPPLFGGQQQGCHRNDAGVQQCLAERCLGREGALGAGDGVPSRPSPFSLAFVCTEDSFEVYVNRQFIAEFKYTVSPSLVDTIYVQGDVKLWKVTLEQNPLVSGGNVRVYHNFSVKNPNICAS